MTKEQVRKGPRMAGEGTLSYWFRLEPKNHGEWIDWYIRDHMPSRLTTTFTGARCFQRVDGSPFFMALYTTLTPEALVAPEYLDLLRSASEDDKRRRAWYQDTMRGCLRKSADAGYGSGGIVGCVRYSVKEAGTQNPDKTLSAIAGTLQKVDGIGRVTCLKADPEIRRTMDGARVTGHDDLSVDRVILVECSAENDLRAAFDTLEALPDWKSLTGDVPKVTEAYRLLYEVSR